jgi:L-amino acid N-acyltransferase YncA
MQIPKNLKCGAMGNFVQKSTGLIALQAGCVRLSGQGRSKPQVKTQEAGLAMEPSSRSVRAATPADLQNVRAQLWEAIDASPYYSERFKAHEKSRFGIPYLRALIAADPWHVAVVQQSSQIAGFAISTPELGTLWSSWTYVAPQFRAQALGVYLTRTMIRHWDNGRFHKIACLVRPDNRVTLSLVAHFGFSKMALLKQHIFGEDYWLLERPLNKSIEGYDNGISMSRLRLLRLKIGDVIGR